MNNINYVNLGEKIKSTRKERGYTQEKLAEICDISTGFLGHIERGTRKLSLDTLFCIATVLNVTKKTFYIYRFHYIGIHIESLVLFVQF